MKLLTAAIINKLKKTPFGSTDNLGGEAKILVKFFRDSWTWYVLEAEQVGNDWRFFGLVEGQCKEFGYFTLSDLESVRGLFGLKVERDLWFDGYRLKDIK